MEHSIGKAVEKILDTNPNGYVRQMLDFFEFNFDAEKSFSDLSNPLTNFYIRQCQFASQSKFSNLGLTDTGIIVCIDSLLRARKCVIIQNDASYFLWS